MSDSKTLVLFTETYPFDAGAEEMFLLPELAALHKAFPTIIIVPQFLVGKCLITPAFVEVDTSFARNRAPLTPLTKVRYAVGSLSASSILVEVLRGVPSVRRARAWKVALRSYVNSQYARDWVRRFIEHRRIDTRSTVFYTYWLSAVTEGLVLAAKSRSDGPRAITSRAHGSDLYEDSSVFTSLPGRRKTLAGLASLFLVSEYGRSYVSRRYPNETTYVLARLGVPDPGGISRASADGVFRIVSCSFLQKVKRIDLLLESLFLLARNHRNQAFEWTHIGSGPQLASVSALANVNCPPNLTCRFPGHLANTQVINEYLSKPVDVFMNVSSSEGIPVSIMEAQSCGIPTIATGVGGTPEIVLPDVGALLPSNPSAECVASEIQSFMKRVKCAPNLRVASRENWRSRFYADANYHMFAEALRSIATT